MACVVQDRDWDSKYVDGVASPGNAPGIVTKSSMLFVVLLLLIFATCHYWTVLILILPLIMLCFSLNYAFFSLFSEYTQYIIRFRIPFISTFTFETIFTSLSIYIDRIGAARYR